MSVVITTDPRATVTVEISRRIAEQLLDRQKQGQDVEGDLLKRIEETAGDATGSSAAEHLQQPRTTEERLIAWRRLSNFAVKGVVVDDSREAMYAADEEDRG